MIHRNEFMKENLAPVLDEYKLLIEDNQKTIQFLLGQNDENQSEFKNATSENKDQEIEDANDSISITDSL